MGERACQRDAGIAVIDRATRKDELHRHEGGCRPALPHQDRRSCRPVAQDHDGCGVAKG